MNEPRTRRSILTAALTHIAGLVALATGAAAFLAGCEPPVLKYGGPPDDYCYEADGGCADESDDAGVAAKYGGPADAGF